MPSAELRRTGLGRWSAHIVYRGVCEDRPKLNIGIVCLSQCLEKVEQAVARIEACSRVTFVRLKLGQCRFFKCEVSMQVDMVVSIDS